VPFGVAVAAVINFVAVNPTGPGNLRIWPYATPPPAAPMTSVLNFAFVPGAGLNLANGAVVTLCDTTATVCPYVIRAQVDGNGAHLVADVVGFFEPAATLASPSFSNVAAAGDSPVPVGPACTNVMPAPLEVVVDGPGTLVVSAVVPVAIAPAPGRAGGVALHLGGSVDDCTRHSHARLRVPASGIGAVDHEQSVPLKEVIDVSEAGRYQFFLNARAEPGEAAGVLVRPAVLEGVFHRK
jgi:hypothetical protein